MSSKEPRFGLGQGVERGLILGLLECRLKCAHTLGELAEMRLLFPLLLLHATLEGVYLVGEPRFQRADIVELQQAIQTSAGLDQLAVKSLAISGE